MFKDILYLLKKTFLPNKYLLKKKILRSLNQPLEPEIKILDQLTDIKKASIDIGVFRGVYTYKLAEISCNVYGFEANPIIFRILNKNLLSLKNNIKLYNYGLSNSSGRSTLRIPIRNKSIFKSNFEDYYEGGLATIENNNNLQGKKYDEFNIKIEKLDNFELKHKIGFIKIDVEGHELSVLEGAKKILKSEMPNLLIEIDNKHSPSVNETFKFLKEMGYQAFYFDNKKLVKIENYSDNQRKDYRNFIFKKKYRH